jgi:hypothetical protein
MQHSTCPFPYPDHPEGHWREATECLVTSLVQLATGGKRKAGQRPSCACLGAVDWLDPEQTPSSFLSDPVLGAGDRLALSGQPCLRHSNALELEGPVQFCDLVTLGKSLICELGVTAAPVSLAHCS